MKTALLVSNRLPGDPAGRANKIETRIRLWERRGWNVEIAHVRDPYIPRFPDSVVRGILRGRRTDPDVVVSINNPFHLHLVGYAVSRAVGAPWVAEFRDPIVTHPDWEEGSVFRKIAARVERLAATRADRLVWLDGIQIPEGYFSETYPDVPDERFVELPPMGFDREAFDAAAPETFEEFTITYAGSFYDGWIEPYGFFAGLDAYLDSDADGIDARFYGDWRDDYDDRVASLGIGDAVSTHPFVPHGAIIRVMKGSDALLYIGGTDPDNRRNLPSKIWDYVGAGTPILGLVDPEFRVADFIRDNDLGLVAAPADTSAVRDAIEALHTGAFEYDPPASVHERYTRQHHADEYVAVLDGLVERDG